MAWLFVRLKLSLLAGSLRGDDRRRAGFALSVLGATVFTVAGGVGLAALGGQGSAGSGGSLAADAVIIVYAALGLSWTLFPLVSFGTDETLDPLRLALFPLDRSQLFRGLLAAAMTGPWPLATLVVLAGGGLGLARGPGSLAVAAVAVPLTWVLSIAASRACTTAMSTLLRSRRGRDVGMAVTLLIMLSVQGLAASASTGAANGADAIGETAAVLRWLPSGLPAHAIAAAADGRYGVALAELAAVAVIAAALLWGWMLALGRTLVTVDASSQLGGRARRSGWHPASRSAAITVKELRYTWRDPRRRMTWLWAIGMTLILSLTSASNGAFFPVFMGAMVAGLSGANAFGADGPALWMHAMVTSERRHLRADLAGKNLATALLGVAVVAAVAVVSGVRYGDPIGRLLLAGWGVLGVGIAVSTLVSVLLPYSVPERRGNVLGHPGVGKGGVAFAAALTSMTSTVVLSLPIVIGLIVGGGWAWVAAGAAPLYGFGLAWAARRLAARIGLRRLPEIIAAVGRVD